jgi:hypothetical protein
MRAAKPIGPCSVDALDEAVVNAIRAATNGGFVRGAARLQEQIAAQLGRRVTPGQAGRPPRKDTERASGHGVTTDKIVSAARPHKVTIRLVEGSALKVSGCARGCGQSLA